MFGVHARNLHHLAPFNAADIQCEDGRKACPDDKLVSKGYICMNRVSTSSPPPFPACESIPERAMGLLRCAWELARRANTRASSSPPPPRTQTHPILQPETKCCKETNGQDCTPIDSRRRAQRRLLR